MNSHGGAGFFLEAAPTLPAANVTGQCLFRDVGALQARFVAPGGGGTSLTTSFLSESKQHSPTNINGAGTKPATISLASIFSA
jgi:hypothetical protein